MIGVVGETGLKGPGDCTSCRPGKYIGGSAALQDGTMGVTCQECNGGMYQNERGATLCKTCQKGFYREEVGYAFCVQCELGRYMMSTQAMSCLTCPSGRYGDERGLECAAFCELLTCKACGKGKYLLLDGEVSPDSCLDCQSGKYSDIDGLATNTCKACGKGKYNAMLGSASTTQCLLCDLGKYSDVKGVISSGAWYVFSQF